MNVFIPKSLNYLNVHRTKVVLAIIFLNVFAAYIRHASELKIYGRVEALGYRWLTYSTLYKQMFNNRIVYSKIGESNRNAVSYINIYEKSESKGNSFITLGNSESIAISHNHIFYLDDKCSLFFSGQEKLAMDNFFLQCFD